MKRDPYSALLLDLSAAGETEDDTDIDGVAQRHLETPVPAAVAPGRDEVTLCAALREHEAKPPWW